MSDKPFKIDVPLTFTAVVRPAEEGGYSAEVPGLPGCITEADSMEELRENLREAAWGWLSAVIAAQRKLQP